MWNHLNYYQKILNQTLRVQSKSKSPPTTRLSWHCPFNVVGCKDWLLNAASLHKIEGEHGWTQAILGITGHKQQLSPWKRERTESLGGELQQGIWEYEHDQLSNQEDSGSNGLLNMLCKIWAVPCMVWGKQCPSWSPSAGLSCWRHRWRTAPHSCIPLKYYQRRKQPVIAVKHVLIL